MTAWRTLVDAQALAGRLGAADLVVFDCRFSLGAPDAGEAAWRASRLPGARYAHLDRDLSDSRSPHMPGSGRHPWPHAEAFVAWLARNGVGARTQVVAYDAADGAYAARLWCLMRALGHHDVAVLDGGSARWCALGLPVDAHPIDSHDIDAHDAAAPRAGDMPPASAPPAFAPPAFTPRFEGLRLFDADGVRARLAMGDTLIDARAAERYRGEVEPIDRVAGHVPGGSNRPYAANLEDGRFKPPHRLADEFRALLGANAPGAAIAMCGSGVTACHHLLAMAHAGLPGAALYTGSWSGWIEDPQRPVATGEA